MRMFFTDRTVRRLVVLAAFLGLLAAFRHLAVLLVCFVLFERILGAGADVLRGHAGLRTTHAVLMQVVLLGCVLGLGVFFGVSRLIPEVPVLHRDINEQFHWVHGWLTAHGLGGQGDHGTRLAENAQHYAGNLLTGAAAVGRDLLQVLLGLILAVIFLIEREDLHAFRDGLAEGSVPRILVQYVSHLCDAVAITARLQVVVALVNTAVTLPVLVALGLPGKAGLLAFLFVMSLIPVVGSVASGAVLGALAFVHRGPTGVVVFTVTTFILHKLESYYLNPRLTSKHVHLPSFVIVTSLILFEHVFGIVGLFMSFPSLYVASRIRKGWQEADAASADASDAAPLA